MNRLRKRGRRSGRPEKQPPERSRLFGAEIITNLELEQVAASSDSEEVIRLEYGDSKLIEELGIERWLERARKRYVSNEDRERLIRSGKRSVILGMADGTRFEKLVLDESLVGRSQVLLPGVSRPESGFAQVVGEILGPLNVIYRCDDRVVEIENEEFNGELDRFKLAHGGLKFKALSSVRAKTWIEQFIETGLDVERKDKPGEYVFMAKTMSEAVARSLLESPQFLKHIPRVVRILDVPIPVRTSSGDIVFPKPGLTRSLGIYCAPDAPQIAKLPIEEALRILEEAHTGFCWKDDQARVHALARLLTPYARGLMGFDERPPLWFFVGNRPRCGKDYLNGVTQIAYLGHTFEDVAITDNSEETAKRIISALRAGRRMMHFANCQHHLDDPIFIQSVTAPTINGRSLGSNDAKSDLELPNEIDYSLSANVGLTYREDVEPRLRKIELAFFEDDPNKRIFDKPFLHQWLKANRARVLSAIHSLFQYWIEKGTPLSKTLFNSFPKWAEILGGVMTLCELGDPCQPHKGEELLGGNEKERAMRSLYKVCYGDWPDQWIRKTDIYDVLLGQRENDERLLWFGDPRSDTEKERRFATARIGNALSAFRDRELDNIRLVIDTSNAKSQQWQYRFTKKS
jgi:hypothetical protein